MLEEVEGKPNEQANKIIISHKEIMSHHFFCQNNISIMMIRRLQPLLLLLIVLLIFDPIIGVDSSSTSNSTSIT